MGLYVIITHEGLVRFRNHIFLLRIIFSQKKFFKLLIPISNTADRIKQSSKVKVMTPNSRVNL